MALTKIWKCKASVQDSGGNKESVEFYLIGADEGEALGKARTRAKKALGGLTDIGVAEVLKKGGKDEDPRQTSIE